MRFARPSGLVYGLLTLLITFASARSLIEKRSTQVSLKTYTFSNNVLAGTISVQNIAFTKVVGVYYAVGSTWSSSPISASYSSGPDSTGYESWTFSGTASGATQFYVQYTVSGSTYYDPGNFVNYQISATATTTKTTSTSTTKTSTTTSGTSQSTTKTTTTTTGSAPVGTSTLDVWCNSEFTAAEGALKRNIGSSSNTLIPNGVVIASPSTQSPNYYFQWIRDASVVMEHLVNEYLKDGSSNLQYILSWTGVQNTLQHLTNPSGSFTSGGLGEPKFNVDNTAFTGSWGRPQRDGPALRAATLMKFGTAYNNVDANYVKNTLYPIIKADLGYVNTNWQQSGFDLWEEVNGNHFFTVMVSYRALHEGAAFATLMSDSSSSSTWSSTASGMVSYIQGFWSSSKGYLIETLNTGRTGLDCGTLLGSLRGNYIYPASSQEVYATTNAYINSFQSLYAINTASSGPGYAVGRYPEDVYDGVGTSQANPWFICTSTVAHVLYRSVNEFRAAGSITVTDTSKAMFQRAVSGVASGTYAAGSTTYNNLITGLNALGDSFLSVVKLHAQTNGSLSEQFSRSNGLQVGARDLTWSYEAILEAITERAAAK